MNSDPNNALFQNWVVCTVCTPKTQSRAHCGQVACTPRAVMLCHCALGPVSRAAASCCACVGPYRSPVSRAAAARPYAQARPCRALASAYAPACRDTTYCVASRTEKWVVAHPSFLSYTFFFWFHLL